jgi:alkyldihydroxyacetonephosphate synthase
VKAAALEAISAGGGTATHHHAVGRDHRPAYDKERPELFAAQLRAAKLVVDPKGLLNPGVLIDP